MESTGVSPNLDCRGTFWLTGPASVDAASPLLITDALPGHCYRFLITVRSRTGQVATATSGSLWVYPTWQGGLDLYRSGVFSTQQTIDWCVPASVQMILNIVDGRTVHSRAEQAEFYRYGRTQNFAINPVPGLDPRSAAALLRRAGQAYTYHRAASLGLMEREAVTQLRRTGKPVILYVDAGIHAWVLTGFTASADPAATGTYAITSFSVMGPLWPAERYHERYYDLPPDARLSPVSFAAAVRAPFHDWAAHTPWEGWWVINEPL